MYCNAYLPPLSAASVTYTRTHAMRVGLLMFVIVATHCNTTVTFYTVQH